MRLFIRVESGKIIDHPVLEENFIVAFPDIDVNNLPANWMHFERVAAPAAGVYEVVEHAGYIQSGEVIKDSWAVRPMTFEEKSKKQEDAKRIFNNRFSTWVFDDALCRFIPPVPYPADGKAYDWDDSAKNWKPMPIPATPDTPISQLEF